MAEQPKSSGHETYVVASVALSCLANILMNRWIKDHTMSDLNELAVAVELKIKNATVEGLSYSQQEALIRRSANYAGKFLDVFREKLGDKS